MESGIGDREDSGGMRVRENMFLPSYCTVVHSRFAQRTSRIVLHFMLFVGGNIVYVSNQAFD